MRVLVTRAAHQGSELAERLRALGVEPVLIPAIETVEPRSFAVLDASVSQLGTFHWLLFTSANAVEVFGHRMLSLREAKVPAGEKSDPRRVPTAGGDGGLQEIVSESLAHRIPASLRIAAIGPSTSRALEKIGLSADLIPPRAIAESLTEELLPKARQSDGSPTRFLLIRAEEAREHLPETLRAAGADVTIAAAYRTVIPESSVAFLRDLLSVSMEEASRFSKDSSSGGEAVPVETGAALSAITFTSSSTARNLLALCEAAGVTLPDAALRISIGPITSQTLRDLGIPPHAEAPEATVASLAEAVLQALAAVKR